MANKTVHTMLYYGHFDRNFHTFTPGKRTYVDADGAEKTVEEPTAKVDGLHFPYMQRRNGEYVAVGVENEVLRAPVLLIEQRHTDGKSFATGPHVGDESAGHLLVDMIVANPELRDVLGKLLIGLQA